MQDRFINFIRENNLTTPDDSILLGVSGGIDSMVMLQLFLKSGFKIAVAHCNFGLRADESDGDEQFVKYYCLMNGIVCHSIKFDTNEYAAENKLSIQVAARELRYAYFEEICKEYKYTKVAIAHNLNDTAETVLINLCRGTGIKGVAGIKVMNGNIIRPLIFATRIEIEDFAKSHDVKYREDSSNSTTKYKRNFIRHKIIPELRYLNPSVDRAIADTANHLQEAVWLVEEQLDRIRDVVISKQGEDTLFSVEALKKERSARFFLVEELNQFGFSPSMASAVIELLNAESGRRVESSTHTLYKDREFLILTSKKVKDDSEILISEDTKSILSPVKLKIETLGDISDVKIEKDPDIALLDCSKLQFPLKIRIWHPGDKFIPFGMSGYKKISDFLVDIKVPLHQKNNVYVLLSGDDIAWVIGYRIDNRFRIDEQTSNVIKFSLT
ncbi:MAG TPA: tRNA lysidine(34) synthetase TilS [Tenuifilaceae bacterium]|nr:tRNA lysidine(34) synthetase TilS [Tenuifilaceae bacterium]HOZ13276.1 tRNA lysidine(34) synthetase TilS [Tenuifilaceae bacterium]HPN20737.1 tRNA lysidine(34) synthetase TilS [Tenuifilaceae bacterium]